MDEIDLSLLKQVCGQLREQKTPDKKPVPPPPKKKTDDDDNGHVIIERVDYENLINFVEIYTDTLEIEDVQDQFEESDFKSIEDFEKANFLYNLGFFYVKIDNNCSPSEFLGVIERIPLEQFCIPGTLQVSFATLMELFGTKSQKLVMQIMVLGNHFKYWELINPYDKMKYTHEHTKLLLSGMGNLTILITPKYLKNCVELLQNVDNLSQKQLKMFTGKSQ